MAPTWPCKVAGWRTLTERRAAGGHRERGPKGILPKNRTSLWSLDCLPEEDNSQFLAPEFQHCCEPDTATCLPLSPYPFLLGVKISISGYLLHTPTLPTEVRHIFYLCKETHVELVCRTGNHLGLKFWARYSDQMVTWPTSVRSKSVLYELEKGQKWLLVDQNTELL